MKLTWRKKETQHRWKLLKHSGKSRVCAVLRRCGRLALLYSALFGVVLYFESKGGKEEEREERRGKKGAL